MSLLVDDAFKYVTALFAEQLPSTCLYHNLTHTKRVFKSTKEIIDNCELGPEDKEVVLLAAVLHDAGYVKGHDKHEIESAALATEFLKGKNASESLIKKVVDCILATELETTPENELEKIIRDADASHFAKDYFSGGQRAITS